MLKHYTDFEKVINSITKNAIKEYNDLPESNTKKYILYKIDNIFCISISNLIYALPLSIESYRYIKKLDKEIKINSPVFYINSDEHKTVRHLRRGHFLTYCILHILLSLKMAKKGE